MSVIRRQAKRGRYSSQNNATNNVICRKKTCKNESKCESTMDIIVVGTSLTMDVHSKFELPGKGDLDSNSIVVVTQAEIDAFSALLDKDHIRHFLRRDSCYRLADKFLLAMVFVYFKRAKLPMNKFSDLNFFAALFLANDMEEDDEDDKYEILLWALGDCWRYRYTKFIKRRDWLWTRMNYRAIVSLKTCNEYMSIMPNHLIWQRNRRHHHAGAKRYYGLNCAPRSFLAFGPNTSPPNCDLCYPPPTINDQSSHSSESFVLSPMLSDDQTGFAILPDFDEIYRKVGEDEYRPFRLSLFCDEE